MPDAPAPACVRALAPDLFAGRVAVVTGGGTGLGLEISRGLAALGARVAIASRSSEHHAPLLAEAADRGWSVEAHALDVREPADVDRVAASVLEAHGRVDVLVNNAAGNFVCPAERMSNRAWRSVLGIVLDGTFWCSRAFGRAMLRQRHGAILNVVATYAYTGMAGVVHSASAKAGVLAMTKSLASEWAPYGIRVNAVAPGPFETQGASERLWPTDELRERVLATIPLGRFATTDEVAAHSLWLLSEQSCYVTGECFVVDGGLLVGQSLWDRGQAIRRVKPERDDA